MNHVKLHYVWDGGTRWFHWINAACVFLLMVLGLILLNAGSLDVSNSGKIILKTIHVCVGYVLVLNLLWRFIWAFRGNQHARWRAILPGGKGYFADLAEYLRTFLFASPKSYLGHNPAGSLAITVMFLLLTTQAITGLFLAGSDIFYPPIGHWIAEWIAAPGIDPATLQPYAVETYDAAAYEQMRSIRKPILAVHLYTFYGLAVLVILHLLAVV
ncbi:MAG TPA: cytochrome b/b6 domain-containing protein, partial [Xanthomonadales bacterium]|nr:cytochrome b/b6 domain-containing protein [Xanthomonadales bacterium]